MQEMWLFGQLNTIGESKLQNETDDKAKEVADLLKHLLGGEITTAMDGTADHETDTSMTSVL